MIYDIISVRKYIFYKTSRGPFVILFYKPDEPRNKFIYLEARRISMKYLNVPFLRFDWKSFYYNFPRAMQNYQDILIIEKGQPNRTKNITDINEIHKILKSIHQKRFKYFKINSKINTKFENRAFHRCWSPKIDNTKFKYRDIKEDNFDESAYIFPNSTAFIYDDNDKNMNNATNLRKGLRRLHISKKRQNFKMQNSPLIASEYIPNKLIENPKKSDKILNKNFFNKSDNKIQKYGEITKVDDLSVQKSISRNNYSPESKDTLNFEYSMKETTQIPQDIKFMSNISPKLKQLNYVTRYGRKTKIVSLESKTAKKTFNYQSMNSINIKKLNNDVLQKHVLNSITQRQPQTIKSLIPPPYIDHNYVCIKKIQNSRNVEFHEHGVKDIPESDKLPLNSCTLKFSDNDADKVLIIDNKCKKYSSKSLKTSIVNNNNTEIQDVDVQGQLENNHSPTNKYEEIIDLTPPKSVKTLKPKKVWSELFNSNS